MFVSLHLKEDEVVRFESTYALIPTDILDHKEEKTYLPPSVAKTETPHSSRSVMADS